MIDLQVLPASNVAHLASPVPGFTGCTAVGEIYDQTGTPRAVYVKAFPGASRGLANELVYWALSQCLDLTTSSAAWILMVEPHFLRNLWPSVQWPDRALPCWATQEIANTSPEVLPVVDSPLIAAELSEWNEVWAVIALHEWLANADGNMGNYVRLAPRRYASIDGAEIFGGQDWTSETLVRIRYIHNKLAHIVGAIKGHRVSDDAALHVRGQAALHAGAFYALEQELIRWLSILCGPGEAHVAANFMKRRIGLVESRWQTPACTLTP